MIGRITTIIIVATMILYSFQSTLWISMLQNVPYMELVVGAVEKTLGISGMIPFTPSSQPFITEFVKALLFTGLYAIISDVVRKFCSVTVGKHARHRAFELSLNNIIVSFLSAIASVVATAYAMEYVFMRLTGWLAGFGGIWGFVANFVLLSIIVLVSFLIFSGPILFFFLWLVTKYIVPTALRLICIELLVAFMYCLLNIPGMLDSIMGIFMMILGMAVCFGAVFGTELFAMNMDDQWKGRGKHY